MPGEYNPKELAYGGLFGAAALTLPIAFHALHLGAVFMPMYLPLMTLPFLAGPKISASTALVVPILSGLITGMPPFYPPVALFMAVELTVMAAVASWWFRKRGKHVTLVLAGTLVLGRVLSAGMGYLLGLWLSLPARFTSIMALVSGWPGILLMMVVIPPLVRTLSSHHEQAQDRP